ncbi:copper-binding protein [Roseibium suaedae]|uniref:Cu and Ag efflux protein CusF n=1 Tax=Roseibium suaedae TaxID=735517 RepID=A0A1M7P0L3_9HYPH|nr:copper-binding protein [Roseibium suaedae]SHN09991.1 Cu and Ag efflux protein CusF [Roseibium suaedae]
MRRAFKLMATAILGLSLAGQALAADYTKGTVRKVDLKSKKVTIAHEDLKNLDMPAMTMPFRVADEAMLGQLKEGDEIEFTAERIKGNLTVTEIKQ